MQKKWLRMSEAAEYSGMSRKTLERRIKEGLLTMHKVCGKVLLDRADIDRMIMRGRVS